MKRISQRMIAAHCNISVGHLNNILAGRKKTPWPVAKALAGLTGLSAAIIMDQDEEFHAVARRLRTISRLCAIAGVKPGKWLDYMVHNAIVPESEWRRITIATGADPAIWDDVPIHQATQDMENEGTI